MRVLVVEDDPVLAKQLADELVFAGYVVETASSGVDAHYLGGVETYDVVVLDLGLPQMDGITILKKWRAAGRIMPVLISQPVTPGTKRSSTESMPARMITSSNPSAWRNCLPRAR